MNPSKMIPFNRSPYTGREEQHIRAALGSGKLSGDGEFGKRCQIWFEKYLNCKKALLTPNCTQSLEMTALLIDIRPGDEVIMPSYTFVSTANAFVLRGASIVFVDVREDTMNIDENLIEAAITPKTKAIVPVHYAGISCEMSKIMDIASHHNLYVIEDAAQGMMSTYRGRPLGSIGHLAAYSFHDTKNYTSGGEGGLLIVNDENFVNRAEIIREKGTNRSQYFRGMVDKYSWVDIGSSYLPSELQAAYLWAQLEFSEEIMRKRMEAWNRYYSNLKALERSGVISLPTIPDHCSHNAHMFYMRVRDLEQRTRLIDHLAAEGVQAAFHYVPLHSTKFGMSHSRFHGDDVFTTRESEKLVRLPLYYGLDNVQVDYISETIERFDFED